MENCTGVVYKKVLDLEQGDVLKCIKDGRYYTFQFSFNEDPDVLLKKNYYYYFGSFIVHGRALTKLFECRNDNVNSKKELKIYSK